MDLILIRKACHASEIGVYESQPGFPLWILFLFLTCLPKAPSSAGFRASSTKLQGLKLNHFHLFH